MELRNSRKRRAQSLQYLPKRSRRAEKALKSRLHSISDWVVCFCGKRCWRIIFRADLFGRVRLGFVFWFWFVTIHLTVKRYLTVDSFSNGLGRKGFPHCTSNKPGRHHQTYTKEKCMMARPAWHHQGRPSLGCAYPGRQQRWTHLMDRQCRKSWWMSLGQGWASCGDHRVRKSHTAMCPILLGSRQSSNHFKSINVRRCSSL